MLSTDKVFSGSIPEIYERLFVPLIFEPYALDLARRIATTQPLAVLETAAGTGVLTRALAAVLPAQAKIVATDLNPPMLARATVKQADDNRIEWRQADALALPFDDQSFDVVACQFGAMFFPDKIKGYQEARRVLASGGRFFFNVWDRISENDFAAVTDAALEQVFPDNPTHFMARTPHGYHDAARIRKELEAAGFSDITVDAVDHISRGTSAQDVAIAYCQGTPLRSEIEARDPKRLEEATAHVASALQQRFGKGTIEGRIRALVFSGQR